MSYAYSASINRKSHRADRLEPMVWNYVSGVMKDPEQLHDDLDRMIELERQGRRGDPDKEAKLWADKLAETETKRARYQEMAAENLITFEELRTRLVELEETHKTAERELAALRSHEEYVLSLERDRDAMLDSLEAVAPEVLDSLTPEQRHHWYKMLRTTAVVNADGTLEVSWVGAPGGEVVCETATSSTYRCLPLRSRGVKGSKSRSAEGPWRGQSSERHPTRTGRRFSHRHRARQGYSRSRGAHQEHRQGAQSQRFFPVPRLGYSLTCWVWDRSRGLNASPE
jgi:hypothetical protein